MTIPVLSLPHCQRYKRLLQAMTLAVAIAYTTLVLYQSAYGYSVLELTSSDLFAVENIQSENLHSQVLYNFNVHPAPNFRLTDIKPKKILAAKTLHAVKKNQKKKSNKLLVSSLASSLLPGQTMVKLVPPIPPQALPIPVAKHKGSRRGRNVEALKTSNISVSSPSNSLVTELDDVFISVKTTKANHDTRLALIIKTWFQLAREQTWFFTDTDDYYYQEKTRGHLINTNCSRGHFRKALCCKMSAELDLFLESGKNWFCHFDDDNYVNVPRLIKLLDEYSPSVDWYLGKPSISSPLEIHMDKANVTSGKITFWFATGGAGFCLSRALTLKMLPVAGGGKFISIGDKIRFPDDVTMGFIIEYLLKVPLTVVDNFHSHLEPMELLNPDSFQDQVSFSYALMKNQWNVIKVNGFDLKKDPKRFYSLHCYLFPHFSFCPPR